MNDIENIEMTINSFAEAMKIKMKLKAMEGRSGWDNPEYEKDIKQALIDHIFKDGAQWVDVANFAMMLWNFKLLRAVNEKAPPVSAEEA